MQVWGHEQEYAVQSFFNIPFGRSNTVFFMFSGGRFIAEGQMKSIVS